MEELLAFGGLLISENPATFSPFTSSFLIEVCIFLLLGLILFFSGRLQHGVLGTAARVPPYNNSYTGSKYDISEASQKFLAGNRVTFLVNW
jgi:hypothetical protein